MTGVVLRCPNCGTTRGTPGECEACHEAQVRYYCTNHAPGRWLETPACSDCGARFGSVARTPVPPAAKEPSRASAAVPASSLAAARRPRYAPGRPKEPDGPGPAGPRERAASADSDVIYPRTEADADPRMPIWQELLLAAARRRPVAREPAPAGRGLGGCLLRMVLMVVFLFLALAGGLVIFGASLLQMFRF